MSKWIDDLAVKGYARIESVFSKRVADKIRVEALNELGKSDRELQQRLFDGLTWPALLFNPKSEYLKLISRGCELSAIVESVLGKDVRQLNNQIYYRLPGDGDQFAWHQDITFRSPASDFSGIETKYLQTIVVVDAIHENAAIEFIPGSHRQGDLNLVPRGTEDGLRVFERKGFRGEKLTAKPGDVLVWSVMTVHGSEPNESYHTRMTYMNGFASADAVKKTGERFPWYLRNGKVVL